MKLPNLIARILRPKRQSQPDGIRRSPAHAEQSRMKLLIGTNNAGKATEIAECLRGTSIELIAPKDLEKEIAAPPETGSSFAENAIQKARHYHVFTGLPTIADDSGIEVDALAGELGVHTRRWGAGPAASDEEWIAYFLKRMKEEENKRARFVCHLAHFDAGGNLHMFQGICDGEITDELEADYLPGLPISACFRPDGYDLVYSAMSVEQKNAISHRGKAVAELRKHLLSSRALRLRSGQAQSRDEQKNSTSHRGRAMKQFRDFLLRKSL